MNNGQLAHLTDEELSAELHLRRKQKKDIKDAEMQKFARALVGVLEEFEKISGKRIVPTGYGYRVEEKKP